MRGNHKTKKIKCNHHPTQMPLSKEYVVLNIYEYVYGDGIYSHQVRMVNTQNQWVIMTRCCKYITIRPPTRMSDEIIPTPNGSKWMGIEFHVYCRVSRICKWSPPPPNPPWCLFIAKFGENKISVGSITYVVETARLVQHTLVYPFLSIQDSQ